MIVMNAETEPGKTMAQGNAAPALRWPRDLAHLWSGWPFGGTWPFRDEPADAAAPIKVEEYVEGEHLVVKAEIPGVDPERDIEVTVDDGVLTITAQRREAVRRSPTWATAPNSGTAVSSVRSGYPRAPRPTWCRRPTGTVCSRSGSPSRKRMLNPSGSRSSAAD